MTERGRARVGDEVTRPGPTVGALVATALASSGVTVHEALRRLGLDPTGEVGDLAEAAERAGFELALFDPYLEGRWRARVGSDLTWLAGVVEPVTRVEETIDVLGALVEDLRAPEARAVLGALAVERRRRGERVALAVASSRGASLEADLRRCRAAVPIVDEARLPAGELVPRLVARQWRRLEAAADEALATVGERTVDLDTGAALAAEARRSRWATELAVRAAGDEGVRRGGPVDLHRALQRLEADLAPIVAARRCVPVLELVAAALDGRAAYLAGGLSGSLWAAAVRAEQGLAHRWTSVAKPRRRRWLG